MAEKFLEELYQHATLVTKLRMIVEENRLNYLFESDELKEACRKDLADFCQKSLDGNYPEAMDMYIQIKHIYEEETDDTVVADIIENAIIPMAERIIQSMGTICQQLDDEYVIESTASGYLTIKNIKKNFYLHSNNNPMWEARKQIREYCQLKSKRFALLGCGLGYHAYQLYRYLRGTVKICIYEENPVMVEYAKKYGVLDWIPEEILEIVTKDSLLCFLKDISDDGTGFYMDPRFIGCLKNEADVVTMQKNYIGWHTAFALKEGSELNLWRNLEAADVKMLEEFDSSGLKEEMVVVAAGPSLDDHLELLREWQGKKAILAVGTVLGKLMRAGIRPDLFVIVDPVDAVAKQIDGMEEENIPFFMDACVNYHCARRYKGPKYMFFSPQTLEEVKYAKEHDREILPSGGTVTADAIIMTVRFHAKAVYLVGVDLAYPGEHSHAADTPDRQQVDISRMLKIPGVGGQTVSSDYLLAGYRDWISDYIQGHQDIRWYNLSKGGAHIEGTIEILNGKLPENPTAIPEGKISIIIPCYNDECNLKECVESLLKQTLPQEMMEMIFINEDSTDSTGKILKEYEQQYPGRIRVIKMKRKSGSGAARNAGMKAAKGDYIGFIDADGHVEPEMYETLYRMMTNANAEIAECELYYIDSNGEKNCPRTQAGRICILEEEAYANETLEEEGTTRLVQRLYRRDFLEKIQLYFPEKVTGEDDFFVKISNYYARRVVFTNKPLYAFQPDRKNGKRKTDETRLADKLKIEVMKVEELKRRRAYEYNVTDIEMQFLRHYFAETLMLYDQDDRELPDGLLFDMQKKVKDLFPDWKQNVLLNEKKNEKIRKISELIDYPFEKGTLEELKKALKEKGVS